MCCAFQPWHQLSECCRCNNWGNLACSTRVQVLALFCWLACCLEQTSVFNERCWPKSLCAPWLGLTISWATTCCDRQLLSGYLQSCFKARTLLLFVRTAMMMMSWVMGSKIIFCHFFGDTTVVKLLRLTVVWQEDACCDQQCLLLGQCTPAQRLLFAVTQACYQRDL